MFIKGTIKNIAGTKEKFNMNFLLVGDSIDKAREYLEKENGFFGGEEIELTVLTDDKTFCLTSLIHYEYVVEL